MVAPVWKLISLILALAVFLVIGVLTLLSGEELLWVVLKSIGSFFISWIVLGFLGNMLFAVVDKQEETTGEVETPADAGIERG
jgi:hypothetical protein